MEPLDAVLVQGRRPLVTRVAGPLRVDTGQQADLTPRVVVPGRVEGVRREEVAPGPVDTHPDGGQSEIDDGPSPKDEYEMSVVPVTSRRTTKS